MLSGSPRPAVSGAQARRLCELRNIATERPVGFRRGRGGSGSPARLGDLQNRGDALTRARRLPGAAGGQVDRRPAGPAASGQRAPGDNRGLTGGTIAFVVPPTDRNDPPTVLAGAASDEDAHADAVARAHVVRRSGA